MKISNLLLVCLLSFVVNASASDQEMIKIGYFKLMPHSEYHFGTESKGLALTYFEKIQDKMKLKNFKMTEYPLPRLLTMLEKNDLDMAVFLAKNSKREKLFRYPKRAFFYLKPAIVLLKDHPLDEVKSFEDIQNLKIGVWTEGFYSKLLVNKKIYIEGITGKDVVARNLQKILSHRLDAFYSPDEANILVELKKANLEDKFKILLLPDEKVGLYTVFSKKPRNLELMKEYENALDEIEKEVTYSKFLDASLKSK